MSIELIGLIGIIVMLILMFLRVPIAISMMIPAFIGLIYIKGTSVLVASIESIVWSNSFSYTLTTIPMFVLMGETLYLTGISSELFSTFRVWFSRFKGGLSMAVIGASAVFAAASGSSVATTGTMGALASREMLKSNYNKSLIGGSIVAGGTIGILIPPSTILIIYGMLSDQSIGKLLIAGIFPGILLTLLFILTVYIAVLVNPKLAPAGESSTWRQRLYSLGSTVWILILFMLVVGGMYVGWFSPTEAAGVGAFGAFIIGLVRKKLSWGTFIESLYRTLRTTGFMFAIVLSAFILNYFLALTRLPIFLASSIADSGFPVWMIFLLIVVMYIILGAIMDAMAMIVITIPIVLPIIQELGFDPIWFGIIIVLLIELALISPPLGMNCFVLNGVAPDLNLGQIFKGALLFIFPILVTIFILYLFPEIALLLPNSMY